MEIGPITGIRVMPVNKVRPVDPELTAAFEIESLNRPADENDSSDQRQAAGAEEPDDDKDEQGETASDDVDPGTECQDRQISFFA
jgi:hypothetical protein